MNTYLRAIGFSGVRSNAQLRPVLDHILNDPETKILMCEGEEAKGYFTQSFGDNIGIKSYVEYQGEGPEREEYYFPYANSKTLTIDGSCEVERKGDMNALLGMCEDSGLQISLIFFVSNAMEYISRSHRGPVKVTGAYITGLCTEGKVLLPVRSTVMQRQLAGVVASKQAGLVEAAKDGDEKAMETLAMDDMRLTEEVAGRIDKEDIYSLIDTYFMPSGMESDRYSIFGQITLVEQLENMLTGEDLWRLTLKCNGLDFTVVINQKDLLGQPAPGLRFKGDVWLQGILRF